MVSLGKQHLSRYKQIVTVLARNGFGMLLEQSGILRKLHIPRRRAEAASGQARPVLTTGERLRRSCEELGPTFVKIGQLLSTRPDLLPSEITHELEKLQDAVPPFAFSEVRAVIETEFAQPLAEVFPSFQETPLASASISQVHEAILPTGQPVVVKVQRPGTREAVAIDLAILRDLASLLDKHTRLSQFYDLGQMVTELEKTLTNELDFAREGENADTFRRNLASDRKITVPAIKWIYSTGRILTMERISGIRISDTAALDAAGLDRSELGVRIATSLINQILRDGFFHADPHPGNIFVQTDGTIVFLDLGMVGVLNESRKRLLSEMFIGIATQDGRRVVKAIVDLGTMKQLTNLRQFEREIDQLLEHYLSLPLGDIKVGEMMLQIFQLAGHYKVKIPGEFTLIAKALATTQGVLDRLDNRLQLLPIVRPIAARLLARQNSWPQIKRKMIRNLADYRELASSLPPFLLNLVRKVDDDDFMIRFDLRNLDKLEEHLEHIFNRLSFSVVLLALAIVMAGIIIGSSLSAGTSEAVLAINLTILRFGLFLAAVIVIGMIISIFRSRRF